MRLAIFDFDGTVMEGNSWHEFFRAELRRRPGRAPLLLAGYLVRRARLCPGRRLRQLALGGLRGHEAAKVTALGEDLYRQRIAPKLRVDALEEIKNRSEDGFTTLLATGAFDFIVAPFAREANIAQVTATIVAFAHGRCLGRMDGDENMGASKFARVRALFRESDVDWAASCCFTDNICDAPLLNAVGERWFVAAASALPSGLPAGTRRCRWRDR